MDKPLTFRKKSRAVIQLEQQLKQVSGKQTLSMSQVKDVLDYSFLCNMPGEESVTAIIGHVNSMISNPLTRNRGLVVLNSILHQCTTSLVVDNATTWVNICINVSPKKPAEAVNFKVLGKIINICHGIQEFDKAIIALLPKVIDLCISTKLNTNANDSALECLKICMRKYASPCGPSRNKIESYLNKYLTHQLPLATLKAAAGCFHALQQIGGAGPNGITHKNNWSNQLTKLCATLHKVYNKFFENMTEFTQYDAIENGTTYELASFTYNTNVSNVARSGCKEAYFINATVLKNIIVFVNQMLVERFPVQKSLSVPQILDVIQRGLSLDIFQQHEESLDTMQFASLLCSLQIDLLHLLRSLIACYKQDLIPFAYKITKLISDCLRRTRKEYFQSNSEYPKAVYKVLNYWTLIAKNKLKMHNKLVKDVVLDITPVKCDIALHLQNSGGKSAKDKNNSQTKITKSNGIMSSNSQKFLQAKEVVCLEALNYGNMLLQNNILKLDADVFVLLFQAVVEPLINIQGGKVQHPYTNPKCQVALYKMLLSIYEQPDYCAMPLLQTGLALFIKGQNRSVNVTTDEISLVCLQGLNVLEKLCQATNPTLHVNDRIKNFTSSAQKYEETESGISESIATNEPNITFEFNDEADTVTDTGAFARNSSSASVSNKLNILNVHIIKKSPGDMGIPSSITEDEGIGSVINAITEDVNNVSFESAEQEMAVDVSPQTQENIVAETCDTGVTNETAFELKNCFVKVTDIKDAEQATQSVSDEEPLPKRAKNGEEEDERMLASFVDSVNDF